MKFFRLIVNLVFDFEKTLFLDTSLCKVYADYHRIPSYLRLEASMKLSQLLYFGN